MGLIVQTVSGEDFYEYAASHVLRPVGMDTSYWKLEDMIKANFPQERLAMPYRLLKQLERHAHESCIDSAVDEQRDTSDSAEAVTQMPYGIYSYPDTPAGNLRTSATQLGRFLAMITQHGRCVDGTQLLQACTVQAMMEPQFPESQAFTDASSHAMGLIWHYRTASDGTRLLGHSGGDPGVSTQMDFIPAGPDQGTGNYEITMMSAIHSFPHREAHCYSRLRVVDRHYSPVERRRLGVGEMRLGGM